jgi:hypothetical protein
LFVALVEIAVVDDHGAEVVPEGHQQRQFVLLADLVLAGCDLGLNGFQHIQQLGRLLVKSIERADDFGEIVFVLFL